MKIKKLSSVDLEQFQSLIIEMFSNLNNLEWFSPMPYDRENILSLINNPRFYIIGMFDNDTLCGVSCLDYKCGKLLDVIDFSSLCQNSKIVEIGFNIVKVSYRGQGIMKKMIKHLESIAKQQGFEYIFGKVHKDNIASYKSFLNCNFCLFCKFSKPVKKEDFINISSQNFFCEEGKKNAKITLDKNTNNDKIIVDYNIYTKKIRDTQ